MSSLDEHMLPCYSKQLLGIDCPGCGLQRSVAFLFEGNFVDAFKMYPAIYPMILFFAFVFITIFIKLKHTAIISSVLGITTVLFILINYILKFI